MFIIVTKCTGRGQYLILPREMISLTNHPVPHANNDVYPDVNHNFYATSTPIGILCSWLHTCHMN